MIHTLTLKIKPPRASALEGCHFFNAWFSSLAVEVFNRLLFFLLALLFVIYDGFGNAFDNKPNTTELKASEKNKFRKKNK